MLKQLLFASLMIISTSLTAQASIQPPQQPMAYPGQLIVAGRANLRRPADEAHLRFGVISNGQTAGDTLQINANLLNTLISTLKNDGVQDSELQTGQFSLTAIYSQRPKDAPDNWLPRIVGYRVENQLQIQTQQLKNLGRWADLAIQNGANSIDELTFGFHDKRSFQDEAIKEATTYAKQDAATLAAASGLRLGKILSVTLNQANFQPLMQQNAFMLAKAYNMPNETPIISGDVDVSAQVTIVYEILQ